MKVIIDSGAGGCIISRESMEYLGLHPTKESKIDIIGIDGKKMTPIGTIENVEISYNNIL
jgi:hypothetical protein